MLSRLRKSFGAQLTLMHRRVRRKSPWRAANTTHGTKVIGVRPRKARILATVAQLGALVTPVAQFCVVRGVDEGSRRYGVASRQSRLEVALAGYARDLRRFALERTRWAVLAGRWPTHTKSSGRALDLDRISGRARAIDGLVSRIDPGAVRGIDFGCVPPGVAVLALAFA